MSPFLPFEIDFLTVVAVIVIVAVVVIAILVWRERFRLLDWLLLASAVVAGVAANLNGRICDLVFYPEQPVNPACYVSRFPIQLVSGVAVAVIALLVVAIRVRLRSDPRWYRALALAVLLAGGGAVSMTLPPDRDSNLARPSDLRANGVSGVSQSWCLSPASCAQGGAFVLVCCFVGRPVQVPFTFEADEPLSSISVRVETADYRKDEGVAVEGADRDGVAVAGEGLVIPRLPGLPVVRQRFVVHGLPPGEWGELQVTVGFVHGGSAIYTWIVHEPARASH